MRSLVTLLLFAAIAWICWNTRAQIGEKIREFLPGIGALALARELPASSPPPPPTPPPAPQGPGIFYAAERITTQTDDGIQALNPGDQVRLMYRFKDGRMRVTDGQHEFVAKPEAFSSTPPTPAAR